MKTHVAKDPKTNVTMSVQSIHFWEILNSFVSAWPMWRAHVRKGINSNNPHSQIYGLHVCGLSDDQIYITCKLDSIYNKHIHCLLQESWLEMKTVDSPNIYVATLQSTLVCKAYSNPESVPMKLHCMGSRKQWMSTSSHKMIKKNTHGTCSYITDSNLHKWPATKHNISSILPS